MEIRKTYQMTLEDFYAFNRHHFKRQLAKHYIIYVALMFIIMTIMVNPFSQQNAVTLTFTVLLISLVLNSLIILIAYSSIRHQSKKLYKSSKAMQSEVEIVADENGVRETGGHLSASFGWDDMFRADASQGALYIYFSKQQAFLIPVRLLTPEEHRDLLALIKAQMPPEKVKF